MGLSHIDRLDINNCLVYTNHSVYCLWRNKMFCFYFAFKCGQVIYSPLNSIALLYHLRNLLRTVLSLRIFKIHLFKMAPHLWRYLLNGDISAKDGFNGLPLSFNSGSALALGYGLNNNIWILCLVSNNGRACQLSRAMVQRRLESLVPGSNPWKGVHFKYMLRRH